MATKESRRERGRRNATELSARLRAEIRTARQVAGVAQATIAKQLSWPQSKYSDFELAKRVLTLTDLCEVAALLGLRVNLSLWPEGEAVRDAGQIKLVGRFRAMLAAAWQVFTEGPFPRLGDLRSWDLVLRLASVQLVGVEAETRVRDQQELVRRIRQRELHGGVDDIVIVLSETAHNRRRVHELRAALGGRYSTPPGEIMVALRDGRPLPGSGVVLV